MKNYDVIIVGSGIAGLTAAVYCARAGKSVLVVEGSGIGGQIATSPCVENYPGFKKISGMELADNLYCQAEALGVETDFDTVESVVPGETVIVKTAYTEYSCGKLIIASGAHHRHLGIDGEEEFSGKGVSYCAVCDGALYKNCDTAVAGGGNTALTSALYLAGICGRVYLIHRRDTFRADAALVEKVRNTPNIIPVLCRNIVSCEGNGDLERIVLDNGESIPVKGLFINIGVSPNTAFLGDLLPLDSEGYVISDESCATAYGNIFVAGDVRSKKVRQLTTAAADGTTAALASIN